MIFSEPSLHLASRLHLPAGESFRGLYALLPWWLLFSMGTFVTGMVLCGLLRRWPLPPWRWTGRAAANGRDAFAVGLFCATALAGFDGPGFIHGFFRQDDFSFLQVTREVPGLVNQMLVLHNDHGYPLFRGEFWALTKLAGIDADTSTLVAWFNGFDFLCCLSLLAAGCWLLHEFGVSLAGLFAFPLLLLLWPGWGEFTTGYYTLCAYVQVVAVGLASAAALVRGRRHRSSGWLGVSLLLTAVAASLDTSGLAVFPMVAAIGLGLMNRPGAISRTRPYWLGFGLLLLLCAAFYFALGHHTYSPRELVQNPRGMALTPDAITSGLRSHPGAATLRVVTLPGAVALAFFAPTFLPLALVSRTPPTALLAAIQIFEIAATAVALVLVWRIWRRLPAPDRLPAGALFLNILAGTLLVVLARSDYAAHVPVPLWHAKYLLIPITWFTLAIVLVVDRSRIRSTAAAMPRSVAVFGLLGIVWMTVSYREFERAMVPHPLAYTGRGRWGNVQNAIARAESYRAVSRDLAEIARQQNTGRVALPPWENWSASFYRRHGLLEWGGDHTTRGVTHLFWDFLAAAPNLRLSGEYQAANLFPPESQVFLSQFDWLAGAFPATPASGPGARLR